jgi:transcriptional regulator with XRE-family HTH domain
MGGRGGICGHEVQYNAEISRRVEELRNGRRLMRSELARAAGVSASMLYNYEVGLTRWPAFRLRLIADYFKVPIDQLVPKTKTYVESPAAPQKLF